MRPANALVSKASRSGGGRGRCSPVPPRLGRNRAERGRRRGPRADGPERAGKTDDTNSLRHSFALGGSRRPSRKQLPGNEFGAADNRPRPLAFSLHGLVRLRAEGFEGRSAPAIGAPTSDARVAARDVRRPSSDNALSATRRRPSVAQLCRRWPEVLAETSHDSDDSAARSCSRPRWPRSSSTGLCRGASNHGHECS